MMFAHMYMYNIKLMEVVFNNLALKLIGNLPNMVKVVRWCPYKGNLISLGQSPITFGQEHF